MKWSLDLKLTRNNTTKAEWVSLPLRTHRQANHRPSHFRPRELEGPRQHPSSFTGHCHPRVPQGVCVLSSPFKDIGYNLQRYRAGEYYHWHVDGGSHDFADRQLVAIWYLNDVPRPAVPPSSNISRSAFNPNAESLYCFHLFDSRASRSDTRLGCEVHCDDLGRFRVTTSGNTMLTILNQVLQPNELAALRQTLSGLEYVDGRASAGDHAGQVKRNEELKLDDAKVIEPLARAFMSAYGRNDTFRSAALPLHVALPVFARYTEGMHYGSHIDEAVMGMSASASEPTLLPPCSSHRLQTTKVGN